MARKTSAAVIAAGPREMRAAFIDLLMEAASDARAAEDDSRVRRIEAVLAELSSLFPEG